MGSNDLNWTAHSAASGYISLCLAAILALIAIAGSPARAHEVKPGVADVTIQNGTVLLQASVNLEALVAGIDLDGLTDTNTAPNAADYDRLRALKPAALEAAFTKAWPRLSKGIIVRSEGRNAPLRLVSVKVSEAPDPALPRTSRLVIRARAGAPVRVGWAASYGALVLRQQGVPEKDAFTGLLSGGELSPPLSSSGGKSEGALETFIRYVPVGVDHIVPKGLDHILFVLGLFFLAPYFGPLLWQVSAFTIAHTVTLALGALGIVDVAPSIVEPLIAASIVFVAVENILARGLTPWRPALIFAFGLLHGLGFATVLEEFGLPDAQFVPALVGFNIGVEVGQLTVIAVAFLAVGAWFRAKPWYRRAIAVPASLAIAGVGGWWVVERTLL